MPKCVSPIIVGEIVVGDVCHIRARNKRGPRYDSNLTLKQRNDFPNLLVLCKTCHKIIDSNEETFSPERLSDIKSRHESQGFLELSAEMKSQAAILFQYLKPKRRVSAKSGDNSVSVAVGGDNNAPITVNHNTPKKVVKSKFPSNSIGADANLSGYVEYLVELGMKYWKNDPKMPPGRIGRKIKTKFRFGATRTRNHIAVHRFEELVNFVILEILYPSPPGQRHMRNGTRPCRSFEEWKNDPM